MTNKEHFIATLQACYFGDRNAFNEIVRIYDDMEQRIDKAVEYIENDLQISILPNNQIINGTEVVKRINKVIDILKGDDTND